MQVLSIDNCLGLSEMLEDLVIDLNFYVVSCVVSQHVIYGRKQKHVEEVVLDHMK
jgi:O-phosphoseryl-tRNA(Cys) synthetase